MSNLQNCCVRIFDGVSAVLAGYAAFTSWKESSLLGKTEDFCDSFKHCRNTWSKECAIFTLPLKDALPVFHVDNWWLENEFKTMSIPRTMTIASFCDIQKGTTIFFFAVATILSLAALHFSYRTICCKR